MEIYSKIQDLCTKKGISISELERIIGTSRGSIGQWNKSAPSVISLSKVADYFCKPVDYFLNREIHDNNNCIANNGDHNIFFNDKGKSDMETALLDMFAKISIMGKIELLGIAKKFVDDKK